MESENEKLASALLAQVYNDYKREKRYQKLSRLVVLFFLIYVAYATFTSTQNFDFFNKKSSKMPIDTTPTIPVVELFGLIGGDKTTYRDVNALLEEAFKNEKATGVILHIESPGGYPYDAHEISSKISRLKEKYPEKKVIAQIGGLGASAAYYIACAADKIYASEASTVGSIGVIMQYVQYNRLLEEYDVIPHLFTSGKNKAPVHPWKDLDENGEAYIKERLDGYFELFSNAVKKGRGERLSTNPDEEIFTGKTWFGVKAKEIGIIDEIGLFDEMFEKEFGNSFKYKTIEIDEEIDFKKLFKMKPKIKIEGVNLDNSAVLS